MRDLNALDIEYCRSVGGRGSPSEVLLTIWGSKGNTVLQLYNYLARIKMPNAMHCIRHLVFSTMSEGDVIVGLQSTINVKYREVILATDNFSEQNILGKGGYGIAYRGIWKNFEVAVKRFRSQKKCGSESLGERLRQSLRELRTLAKYRHDNILPLYGISLDGEDPCLIYQYMANGSLEDRLQLKGGSEVLTWQQRKIIAEGSARGLLFLHTGSDTPIIHGDIKTANILLDRHFEPKLGDFGLCRNGPEGLEDDNLLIASHVKGTYAYLPPEFTKSKIVSTKLDIYSFGVVLLEIASGSKVYVENRDKPNLLQHVLHLEAEYDDNEDKFISLIIDKNCPGDDGLLKFICSLTLLFYFLLRLVLVWKFNLCFIVSSK
uniref:non-specific serine/threonine protein kinase n=1 Tax=Syphacia muris TaxID=451379 RepID=A0A0N5A9Q8_9BILA